MFTTNQFQLQREGEGSSGCLNQDDLHFRAEVVGGSVVLSVARYYFVVGNAPFATYVGHVFADEGQIIGLASSNVPEFPCSLQR